MMLLSLVRVGRHLVRLGRLLREVMLSCLRKADAA